MTLQLQAAEKELKELRQTVDAVESNRATFVNISDAELQDRKKFISRSKKALNAIKDDLGRMPRAAGDATSTSTSTQKMTPASAGFGARESGGGDGGGYVARDAASIQLQLSQQDEVSSRTLPPPPSWTTLILIYFCQDLEELGQHVDRVGVHAQIINAEIKDQGRMLEALDDDLERAQEDMGFVMGSLSKLLKTKSRCQIWTVMILAIILIVLVACTIWT